MPQKTTATLLKGVSNISLKTTQVEWRRSLLLLGIVGVISLLTYGCAGTPKVSNWTSPQNFTTDDVFNAALVAATENKFTVVSQDKSAGIMSLKKQEYGGDKMAERVMSVRVKQDGENVVVSTKVSGSDFGIIEGSLGGLVHKELTNNFYVYLFRELGIDDPAQRNVVIESAK